MNTGHEKLVQRVVFWWGRPARPTRGSKPWTEAKWLKILHVKGRKSVDKDLSQSRKSKLEFLHFKAVCVQTLLNVFVFLSWAGWVCLSSCWGVIQVFFRAPLLFHAAVLRREAKSIFSVVCSRARTRCWHRGLDNGPIQRKWRALWVCWRSQRAGGWTVMSV